MSFALNERLPGKEGQTYLSSKNNALRPAYSTRWLIERIPPTLMPCIRYLILNFKLAFARIPRQVAWRIDVHGSSDPHMDGVAQENTPDWMLAATARIRDVVSSIKQRDGPHKFRASDFEALRAAIGIGLYGK